MTRLISAFRPLCKTRFMSIINNGRNRSFGSFKEVELDSFQVASFAKDDSFQSLGLGCYCHPFFPSAWIQTLLETIHISLNVPWWTSIVITTLGVRILLFPLVIRTQKQMIKLNHFTPEMQKLQLKMIQAGQTQDREARRSSALELDKFMKEHQISPWATYKTLGFQALMFMSIFVGIREITLLPVQSLTSGGLWWFIDLVSRDQFFVLPALTSISMLLQIKLSADIDTSTFPPILKKFLMIMPIISLPITSQFAAALNLYWLTNNIISLVQIKIIRTPILKKKLKIGEIKKWTSAELPLGNFTSAFKIPVPLKDKS